MNNSTLHMPSEEVSALLSQIENLLRQWDGDLSLLRNIGGALHQLWEAPAAAEYIYEVHRILRQIEGEVEQLQHNHRLAWKEFEQWRNMDAEFFGRGRTLSGVPLVAISDPFDRAVYEALRKIFDRLPGNGTEREIHCKIDELIKVSGIEIGIPANLLGGNGGKCTLKISPDGKIRFTKKIDSKLGIGWMGELEEGIKAEGFVTGVKDVEATWEFDPRKPGAMKNLLLVMMLTTGSVTSSFIPNAQGLAIAEEAAAYNIQPPDSIRMDVGAEVEGNAKVSVLGLEGKAEASLGEMIGVEYDRDGTIIRHFHFEGKAGASVKADSLQGSLKSQEDVAVDVAVIQRGHEIEAVEVKVPVESKAGGAAEANLGLLDVKGGEQAMVENEISIRIEGPITQEKLASYMEHIRNGDWEPVLSKSAIELRTSSGGDLVMHAEGELQNVATGEGGVNVGYRGANISRIGVKEALCLLARKQC